MVNDENGKQSETETNRKELPLSLSHVDDGQDVEDVNGECMEDQNFKQVLLWTQTQLLLVEQNLLSQSGIATNIHNRSDTFCSFDLLIQFCLFM